ncbi:MAG TPA: DUF559 domain-containing protein [Firmicutes bacterium]|jgi:very-short-patch-repair endonuclease|nr:DUF559 domain-containing protein [Bacillota bacterium]
MRLQPSITAAQKKLAQGLREKKIPYRENQKVAGWEVDILIPLGHLAVEIDGFFHLSTAQQMKDEEKTAQLTAAGYHVLRFTNTEIHEDCEACVERINSLLERYKARVKEAQKEDPAGDAWRKNLRKFREKFEDKTEKEED